MKIKMLTDVNKEGIRYTKGETYNIDKSDAGKWVSRGYALKEEKAKKQTKELKVKKETK